MGWRLLCSCDFIDIHNLLWRSGFLHFSVVISKQSEDIKNLVQEVALLKERFRLIENKPENQETGS